MSDFSVVLAQGAQQDIADAFHWYLERNALAADGFRAEVVDAIDRIAIDPLSRAADDEGHRRRALRRFPYSVIFEVAGDTVTVWAVAHHRRRPGYWQRSA